ncbi:hypothetical protein H634G_09439 [Metarhizium anisopliae BRIP 53293]|uniref:Piwi domain-containing protein n=1 Tax=Metarhizium anisopliae BRIP 53293 TaxID=1291518 RepID=A0A0D9NND7_METAN|nr:hypothetical protein H634G_09439 [Metarhizium anisopliae BRIP 53293]
MTANSHSLQKLAAFLTNLSVNVTHIVKTNRQGDVIKRIKMITGLATQMDGRDNQYPPRIAGFGAGPKDVEFFLAGSLSPPKRAEGHKKGKKVQVVGPSQRVDGRYVSVYEHFEETYKIIIRDTTLPVINVGTQKNPSYGSWNLRSLQANLARGTYLSISVRGKDHPWANILELKSLLDRFRDTLRKLGINAGECVKGLDIELLLVILPASDNVALYNRVKFACHVEAGLINVCVVGSKFSKVDEQYYANVGLKVNLKLRGQNYYIDGSQLGILGEGKTMLVGIHVTHPSPGSSQNAPSVAGIVASVDKQLAQWPAELRIQAAQQEMVSGLDDLLKSRLVLWRKHNPSYPENILVCRDGVSEEHLNWESRNMQQS